MVFAADHDVPIPYLQRTRDYYQRVGFPPYRWAHFAEVPFTSLAKPLEEKIDCSVEARQAEPGWHFFPGFPGHTVTGPLQIASISGL
jgi:hypothetical protein